jgi:glycosyl transferase family 25
MNTYVINLERSPKRRAHITAELDKARLTYELVPAVDGRELDLHDETIIAPAMSEKNYFLAGSAGCALSHLRVYERIVAVGVDQALVLEDDVMLPSNLAASLEAVAPHLTGAEVALLNYSSWNDCLLSREGSVGLSDSRVLALPANLESLCNAAAYVLTNEACERMIRGLLPLRANADNWNFFFEHQFLDRIRCVYPMPVTKSAEFESTIGIYSLGSGIKARVLAPVVQRRVPGLHRALVRRRERIQRDGERTDFVEEALTVRPSRLD